MTQTRYLFCRRWNPQEPTPQPFIPNTWRPAICSFRIRPNSTPLEVEFRNFNYGVQFYSAYASASRITRSLRCATHNIAPLSFVRSYTVTRHENAILSRNYEYLPRAEEERYPYYWQTPLAYGEWRLRRPPVVTSHQTW